MAFANVITLLSGLAMFLYGMTVMGNGLEALAGGKLENILQKLTSSVPRGVLLGTAITAIIQSSSATTVIVIGLVNSGIMTLVQASGVIMGANVGTTVTGQIIRLAELADAGIVFQILNPKILSPIALTVGTCLFVFLKVGKRKHLGQMLLGFGILFTGLFTMENAVMPLRESQAFVHMFTSFRNPVIGVLAGMLVTAVIQSSSASLGILQALSATAMVTWSSAIPIILGTNIGTTVTALLASIGASPSARRVAYTHVYFNLIGSFIWLIGIYAVKAVVGLPFFNDIIGMGDIANFHTAFNIITTILFIPFAKQLINLSSWSTPQKSPNYPELSPVILDTRLYTTPSLAITQAKSAVLKMGELALLNTDNAISCLFSLDEKEADIAEQREDMMDKLDVITQNYLVGITRLMLNDEEGREVTTLLSFVIEYERMGDYAINVVERVGEMRDKNIRFSESARGELLVLRDAVRDIIRLTNEVLAKDDITLAERVEPLEENVDEICENLRGRHITRLKNGGCSIEAGIIYLEVLTNYERISDHCSNVAAHLIESRSKYPDRHTYLRHLHEGGESSYNTLYESYKKEYKLPETV
jgi:phosphate:Na+ symporter